MSGDEQLKQLPGFLWSLGAQGSGDSELTFPDIASAMV